MSFTPISRLARREALNSIKENDNPIGSVKVPGYGSQKVYRIPIDKLSYNPYNTRFLAQAKTLEKRLGRKLSDEIAEDVEAIEEFIWKEKEDRNINTIESLLRDGQLCPGVVTSDGVILSGNRRFRLINQIVSNPSEYSNYNTAQLQYFEAAILDIAEISEKEIVRLESFFQYGTEDKVGYNPIQKYIAASYQNKLGLENQTIADNFRALTDGKESKVKEWIDIFELMQEYLSYIDEEGIYTALGTNEESFINLYSTLKSYTRGVNSNRIWAFDEFDLDDLKLRYFDYIRLNFPTHNFRIFKSIFSDENHWKQFNDKVQTLVENNAIGDFQSYRNSYSNKDENEISKIRNNDYYSKFGDELNSIFGEENAYIISVKNSETPISIAKQIQQKIEKLENEMNKHPENDTLLSPEFLETIKNINERIESINNKID